MYTFNELAQRSRNLRFVFEKTEFIRTRKTATACMLTFDISISLGRSVSFATFFYSVGTWSSSNLPSFVTSYFISFGYGSIVDIEAVLRGSVYLTTNIITNQKRKGYKHNLPTL